MPQVSKRLASMGRAVTTFTYDEDDELLIRRYPDASRASFSYDPVGNRNLSENVSISTTVTYDAVNRHDDLTTDYLV